MGWWNGYRNILLIFSGIITAVAFLSVEEGLDPSIFGIGFAAGILAGYLYPEQRALDKIKGFGGGYPVKFYLVWILFLIVGMLRKSLRVYPSSAYLWQAILSFSVGFGLTLWLSYFQIVGWERQNNKTVTMLRTGRFKFSLVTSGKTGN